MAIFYIGLGAILLFLGRQLFWLFVGILGFVAGIYFVPEFMPAFTQYSLTTILISMGIGALCAAFAIFIQKAAVWLGGFLAGGFLVSNLVSLAGIGLGNYGWMAFVVGGIIGAIFMAAIFDWALVILSSVVGTMLIVQNAGQIFTIEPIMTAFLAFALFIFGVVVQMALGKKRDD